MPSRMVKGWYTVNRSVLLGCLWMAGLLGVLTWLDLRYGANFLLPPFAATLTILVYLPNTAVAQPVAVVCGSVFGVATGTVFSLVLGSGVGVAMLAALAAMIMLPLLRVFHPPGIALAMCPPLLHLGPWFAPEIVLPFTLVVVISWAMIVAC